MTEKSLSQIADYKRSDGIKIFQPLMPSKTKIVIQRLGILDSFLSYKNIEIHSRNARITEGMPYPEIRS